MIDNLKTIAAGDVFIRQGTSGQSAYVIEQGQVEIYLEKPDGSAQVVGTRGPGAIIGEMALIDEAPRTASIRALEDCKLIEITREDFRHRLSSSDTIMRAVMRVLLTRYRDMLQRSSILAPSPGFPPPEELERHYLEETHTLDDLRMESEFRAAMHNGQLSLNYQPIVFKIYFVDKIGILVGLQAFSNCRIILQLISLYVKSGRQRIFRQFI